LLIPILHIFTSKPSLKVVCFIFLAVNLHLEFSFDVVDMSFWSLPELSMAPRGLVFGFLSGFLEQLPEVTLSARRMLNNRGSDGFVTVCTTSFGISVSQSWSQCKALLALGGAPWSTALNCLRVAAGSN
jgi:hypothetical protein